MKRFQPGLFRWGGKVINSTEYTSQMNDAYTRAEVAYAIARAEVYDLYPAGLPPLNMLTEHQQLALLELSSSEQEICELRRPVLPLPAGSESEHGMVRPAR